MATPPPRPQAQDGTFLLSRDATLIPFHSQTAPIIFWNLGTKIPGNQWKDLRSRVCQIQSADQQFKRPIMADVLGKERQISREVSMIGSSPRILNSDIDLLQYRNMFIDKTRIAPGRFFWTWIQTEPTLANARWRSASNKLPIIIEPEQIRLQTYATISAGCRGIAYWTTSRLDEASAPGALERNLAIRQLNMELDLIESWLATGTVTSHVPFTLKQRNTPLITQLGADFKNSGSKRLLRDEHLEERKKQLEQAKKASSEMSAAIIHTEHGTLILPVWYQNAGQFVPDQMAGNDATIIVPGGNGSAAVWELSTTEIKSLHRKRVSGGVQITIPKFDMTSIILMTSDRGLIENLRKKVAALSPLSAKTSVQLCRAKLERCQKTNAKLVEMRVSQIARMDGPAILKRAQNLSNQAEAALSSQNYHAARTHAQDSMQMLRILQRSQWNEATRALSSALMSPYTVSYNTLPDHWKLIEQIGRSAKNIESNKLRSGDFEDIDTMKVERWVHQPNSIGGIEAFAELYPKDKKSGEFSLRLLAAPLKQTQYSIDLEDFLVKVKTPPIDVRSGQLVHITGWIKIASPIRGTQQGFTLTDSIMGPSGALHWKEKTDWRKFDIIREVPQSENLILTMSLNGLGSVLLDDLRIIAYTPEPKLHQHVNQTETLLSPDPKAPPSRFNLLKNLPKLSPFPAKK